MRKMVNTLQSIHMAIQSNPNQLDITVDRNYVFKHTGFPNPEDIDRIFEILTSSDDILKAYESREK